MYAGYIRLYAKNIQQGLLRGEVNLPTRKFVSDPSLGSNVTSDMVYKFMIENYTKDELNLFLDFLYEALLKSTDFNSTGPTPNLKDYPSLDSPISYYYRGKDGYFFGLLKSNSEITQHFKNHDLKKILDTVYLCNILYEYVWLPVSSLATKKVSSKEDWLYVNAILEWKYTIDYTKEEVESLKKNMLKRVLSSINKVVEHRTQAQLLKEKYTKKDLIDLFDYLLEFCPQFVRIRPAYNIINNEICSPKNALASVAENILDDSCLGDLVNSDGMSLWWYEKGQFYKDFRSFLLKPLEDMPLCLRYTMIKGWVARWRLKVGK